MAISPEIGYVGASFRSMPLGALETYVPSADTRAEHLAALGRAASLREMVYLATCNRLEIYYAAESPDLAGRRLRRALSHGEDDEQCFAAGVGRDAVSHLFSVAAGLDSMVVGEPQIFGQVKDAFHSAVQSGTAGPVLRDAFRAAFRTARTVRRETGMAAKPVSVASLAVREAFGVAGARPGTLRVGVLGAGPMAVKVARHAARRSGAPPLIINRSEERGREVASDLGAEFVPLGDFIAAPPPLDVLFLVTAAGTPILSREVITTLAARSLSGILIADLSLPRNLPSGIEEIPGVVHMNLQSLDAASARNRQSREKEVGEAERILGLELARFQGARLQRARA